MGEAVGMKIVVDMEVTVEVTEVAEGEDMKTVEVMEVEEEVMKIVEIVEVMKIVVGMGVEEEVMKIVVGMVVEEVVDMKIVVVTEVTVEVMVEIVTAVVVAVVVVMRVVVDIETIHVEEVDMKIVEGIKLKKRNIFVKG